LPDAFFQAVARAAPRFVDDAQHLQPGDLAGILGGLALLSFEIGRDGDDRLADLLAQEILGGLLIFCR